METIGLQAALETKSFDMGLSRYTRGVASMEGVTDKVANAVNRQMSNIGGAVVAAGAATAVGVTAAIASITALSKKGLDELISWNDEVGTLIDNLGTTGEQSSAWAVAFEHVGLSVTEGGAGLNFFVKSLDGYSKAVAEGKGDTSDFGTALRTLGVRAFDANGNLRTFDDVMPDLLDAFQKMPGGVNKSALAMQLFGARAGTKFLDFLSQGSEGLEKAREMAKLYGLELDTDLSDATEEFTFQMNDLNLGMRGFWVSIGREVLPVASRFVGFISGQVLPPLMRWAREVMPQLIRQGTLFTDWLGIHALPVLTSVWNIVRLLATNDFDGGIFGLREDDIFLSVLFRARELVVGLFDTLSRGDWAGAWQVITDVAANFYRDFVGQFGEPGDVLREWGAHIWDWIEDTAVPTLQTEGGKLVAGITTFLADNGPRAWAQLKTWATDFWNWLTGRGGALETVGVEIFKVASGIAAWLKINWDTTVAPALSTWATEFWTWLTGPGGVILSAASNLEQLTVAIREWVTKPETQQALQDVGEEIGKGIVAGIKGLFSNEDTGNSFVESLLGSISRAVQNLYESIKSIGQGIVGGIIKNIVTAATGDETKGELAKGIFRMISEGVSKFITDGGLIGVARRMIEAFVKQLQQTMLDFHVDFSSLWTPSPGGATMPPLRFTPPPAPGGDPGSMNPPPQTQPAAIRQDVGGGGGGVASAIQAMPLSLVVTIDGMEIQHAVVRWVTGEVQSQFGEATTAPVAA